MPAAADIEVVAAKIPRQTIDVKGFNRNIQSNMDIA
jgi:hypothetical protein